MIDIVVLLFHVIVLCEAVGMLVILYDNYVLVVVVKSGGRM